MARTYRAEQYEVPKVFNSDELYSRGSTIT